MGKKLIPKPKAGMHGKPRGAKPEIKHPIYNIRGIAERGHRKARFRASFRARLGRMPGLTDKFFRLFSMFLVCLVLFATVTNASYSTYQNAVNGVYHFTEGVSKVSNIALKFVFDTIEFTYDMFDDGEAETPLPGGAKMLSLKLDGEWVNFSCIEVHVDSWTSFNSRSAWKIIDAPYDYEGWIGKRVEWCFFWWKLPNGKLITTKKINVTDYVIEGE